MQIISGQYKGKNLKSPENSKTHPMGSREKLALFNMLQPYLENATVLDAYAGTGALGLEALSRGANRVIFVEKSPQVAKIIKDNIAGLNDPSVKANTAVIITATEEYKPAQTFDLIIADPPYDHFEPEKLQSLASLLSPNGVLALSHPTKNPPEISGLNPGKTHSFAAANITLYFPL